MYMGRKPYFSMGKRKTIVMIQSTLFAYHLNVKLIYFTIFRVVRAQSAPLK